MSSITKKCCNESVSIACRRGYKVSTNKSIESLEGIGKMKRKLMSVHHKKVLHE